MGIAQEQSDLECLSEENEQDKNDDKDYMQGNIFVYFLISISKFSPSEILEQNDINDELNNEDNADIADEVIDGNILDSESSNEPPTEHANPQPKRAYLIL